MADFYRVVFTQPTGFEYEMTGEATSPAEAVKRADELLEYVERISISDYLLPDGVTVRAPAQLTVHRTDTAHGSSGFDLVVRDPGGTVC